MNKTIFRVAIRRQFAQIANAMLRDTRLSLDARGALAFILSHPDDWSFNVEWLCRENNIGRDKADRIIRELKDAGYCIRSQHRASKGRFGAYVYWFGDNPEQLQTMVEAETSTKSMPAPLPGFPDAVEPDTVEPHPANPETTNTEPTNTERTNVPLKSARAARSEAGQDFKGEKGQSAPGAQAVDDRSISRVEGLGIDTAPLVDKVRRPGVKNARALFLTLAHKKISEAVPGLARDVIVHGLTGPENAYKQLLLIVTQATLR